MLYGVENLRPTIIHPVNLCLLVKNAWCMHLYMLYTRMVVAEYDLYILFSLADLCQIRIEMMIWEKYYMSTTLHTYYGTYYTLDSETIEV